MCIAQRPTKGNRMKWRKKKNNNKNNNNESHGAAVYNRYVLNKNCQVCFFCHSSRQLLNNDLHLRNNRETLLLGKSKCDCNRVRRCVYFQRTNDWRQWQSKICFIVGDFYGSVYLFSVLCVAYCVSSSFRFFSPTASSLWFDLVCKILRSRASHWRLKHCLHLQKRACVCLWAAESLLCAQREEDAIEYANIWLCLSTH